MSGMEVTGGGILGENLGLLHVIARLGRADHSFDE